MEILKDNITFFINLLKANSDRVLKNIVEYSEVNDHILDSQESIISVELFLNSVIKKIEFSENGKLEKDNPSAKLILSEAEEHHRKGTPFNNFIKLVKYYKSIFLEIIEDSSLNFELKYHFSKKINNHFDELELLLLKEWTPCPDELKESIKYLTHEKNKYLTIFECFYSPIIVLDGNNRIVNLNFVASHLFPEFKIFESFLNKEKPNETIKIIDERLVNFVTSSLKELSFESYMPTSIGERFFLVKLKKIVDMSETFRVNIIIFDDLTERKEMERQFELAKTKAEEADKLKTAFLANLSHEIRTPMNAIIGFSDLLLMENDLKNEKKEYLQLIQKSGNNLLKLIDDIIDVAKIESKQLKINIIECNINDLLKDLFSIFEELLKKEKKKNIEIKLICEKESQIVKTDPDRFKQVFCNLINNAIKFTQEGFIEFGYNKVNNKNFLFFVKDTGIGIPKENQELIFERFYQVEGSYSGGTGLGLAISKNIINLLGGEIWVESEVNSGSAFNFRIPIESNSEKKTFDSNKTQPKDSPWKNSWKNYKILIAEDEEINFYYLMEVLKKTGVKILWAKNGLEAINLAESNTDIDLVLMDIKMPEVNGLEAIKYIHDIRPNLPIVAQTAFVTVSDRQVCIKSGCIDFLTKPIKESVLLNAISKVFKNTDRLYNFSEPEKKEAGSSPAS